jgi:hypothetical protein
MRSRTGITLLEDGGSYYRTCTEADAIAAIEAGEVSAYAVLHHLYDYRLQDVDPIPAMRAVIRSGYFVFDPAVGDNPEIVTLPGKARGEFPRGYLIDGMDSRVVTVKLAAPGFAELTRIVADDPGAKGADALKLFKAAAPGVGDDWTDKSRAWIDLLASAREYVTGDPNGQPGRPRAAEA